MSADVKRLEKALIVAKDGQTTARIEHDLAVERLVLAEQHLALVVERLDLARKRAQGAS